jgi:uncharacterized protein (DUF488 family)
VRRLFTVGHGTRSLEELTRLCGLADVTGIVDVRRFPGSRRSPHFARQALADSLPAQGMRYLWIPELGGRRRRARGAAPSPWRVEAFAAYAEHMNSAEFRVGFARLIEALGEGPTAIMCAETSPYRCHRRLISDFAELHGIEVMHLLDERRRERHRLTPFATRVADDVVYELREQLALPSVLMHTD